MTKQERSARSDVPLCSGEGHMARRGSLPFPGRPVLARRPQQPPGGLLLTPHSSYLRISYSWSRVLRPPIRKRYAAVTHLPSLRVPLWGACQAHVETSRQRVESCFCHLTSASRWGGRMATAGAASWELSRMTNRSSSGERGGRVEDGRHRDPGPWGPGLLFHLGHWQETAREGLLNVGLWPAGFMPRTR